MNRDNLLEEIKNLRRRVTELEAVQVQVANSERALRESEERFRLLYENAPLAYQSLDEDGNYLEVNQAWLDFLGYSRDEVIGKWCGDFLTDEYREKFKAYFRQFKSAGAIRGIEFEMARKDGSTVLVTADGKIGSDRQGHFKQTHCILHNVTESKKAAEALRRLNRQLQALSSCNQSLMRAADEQTLLTEICRTICDQAGYRLAWVGYAESDDEKTLRPVAWSGVDSGYIGSANLSWAEDTERGKGPAGTAVRTGETVYVQDFANDPRMAVWRESVLRHGYRSGIALPLKDENTNVFGALLIYAAETYAISPEEIRLMEQLAGDLAYGIVVLRTRAERKKVQEALDAANRQWERTFNAISDAIMVLDDQYRIVRANKAASDAIGMTDTELIGQRCFEVVHGATEPPVFCPYSQVLADGEPHSSEVTEPRLGTILDVQASPILDQSRKVMGSVHVTRDITERKKSENILLARLRLMQYAASHSLDELLQATLDEAEVLTNSLIGFYHFVDAEEKSLTLQAWSTRTLREMCTIAGKGVHYTIDEAGVWVDCVHQRRPVIHNDYSTLAHRKGMPAGHANVIRELVVPVFRKQRIVAILGVGNKAADYDSRDIESVSLLADLAWDIAERKRAEEALQESRERLELALQGGDLGLWDWHVRTGQAVTNQRTAELVGYTIDEIEQSFEFWESLLHPDDRRRAVEKVFNYLAGSNDHYEDEYRVKHKSGDWRWILSRGKVTERDPDGKPLRMTGTYLNITDKKMAESRASEANELRERIVSESPVGIAVYRADGQCISANEALAKIIGADKERLLSQNFRTLSSWKACGLSADADLALSEDVNRQREVHLTSTFGQTRWVNARMSRITPGGEPHLLLVFNDITERRTAEEALKFEREQLLSLFESINEVILVIDPITYEILYANKFTEDLFGKLLIGGVCYERLHAFDAPCGPCMNAKILELGGKPCQWEYSSPILKKDFLATDRMVRWPDGRDVKFHIAVDITERKQAQEKSSWLAAIVESSDDAIIGKNLGGIITSWNKGAAKIYGYQDTEVVGRPISMLAPPTRQDEVWQFLDTVKRGGHIEHYETVRKKKDGREIDVSLSISPIRDTQRGIIGASTIAREITEQKSLQKQLLQAQKMESIGTLAGGIAHDFNNLLQVIIGYSDMLLFDRKPSDPEYEGLRAIHHAGKDGAELANRILAFSRRLEPNFRPVGLNNEIIRIRKMLERTLPKMIRIQTLLAENLMVINADPGQLEQILLNLAVNAQHAMPDGGQLTLETTNVCLAEDYARTHLGVEPGKYVLLAVSDTGHGMNREVMEHIFEPFYTTKGPGIGTGLGLAMVFGIVKNHKGHITCYSEPGTGTTFKIYLPAIVQEVEQDSAVTQQMPAFGTETILLVDDETSILKLGEQMLRMAGYRVLMATNGIEALEVYRSNQDRIALVLLDLMMPEMGGKQCLEELLKINPGVRVIIASGYLANGPIKESVEADTKGFVSKPYDTRQLLEIVRTVLDVK